MAEARYKIGELVVWTDNQMEIVGTVREIGVVPSTGLFMYRLTASDGYEYAARFDESALYRASRLL